MLDDENPNTDPAPETAAPETAAPDNSRTDPSGTAEAADEAAPAKKTAKKTTAKKTAKKSTRKSAAKKSAAPPPETPPETPPEATPTGETAAGDTPPGPEAAAEAAAQASDEESKPVKKTAKKTAGKKSTAKKATTKKTTAKKSAAKKTSPAAGAPAAEARTEESPAAEAPAAAPAAEAKAADVTAEAAGETAAAESVAPAVAAPLFQPPTAPARRASKNSSEEPSDEQEDKADQSGDDESAEQGEDSERSGRRRRRRGGRRRRKSGNTDTEAAEAEKTEQAEKSSKPEKNKPEKNKPETKDEGEQKSETSSRRRRRRRRAGDEGDTSGEEPENTVTKVRKPRSAEDEITALTGSTRLEAKRQRRREGREAGRRRAPIVSEAEFLARRESVDRVMVIRQREDLTQIAVLEDNVLVEHYVARESQTSLIGNVYLGRVQNVLPSMEAAFIDIGKGRNAVLYAGEVNWQALGGKDGNRKIEQVLKSGQSVLVQVTKDPVGHKGARLTSQIALPGRFLVYVPDGTTSGISRKLPDTERNRLKNLLKQIVPESAGVIVRTAAEGASEEELTRDVERLTARWNDISTKAEKGNAPQLLYGEPDLTLKVVRDLFTEDFGKLVVSGDDAWDMVDGYVEHVAPDLADRLERYDDHDKDVFAEYRIDEQIAKGLDRKVWLPSGGSLIIDRTEAMTVIDVNTGKFTGAGGNLEETVTKNNLEAAEEIVRQLRLRDIGGIVVIDFIDMVLESNRDLVLRRLVECLGRDRTRHQVAEVTSLGLVQMTRKRIGTGLLEAFSESCEHCQGRGVVVHHEPIEQKKKGEEEPRRSRRSRGRGKEDRNGDGARAVPSPKDIAAIPRPEQTREETGTEAVSEEEPGAQTQNGAFGAEVEEDLAADVTAGQPSDSVAATVSDAEPDAAVGNGARREESQREEPQRVEPQGVEPQGAHAERDEAQRDEPAPEHEAGSEPEQSAGGAPKLVTSVRRRSVRPAGPPSTAGSTHGSAAEASEGTEDGSSSAAAHVPVKTRSGRRR